MTAIDPAVVQGLLALAKEKGLLDGAVPSSASAMPEKRRPHSLTTRFLTIAQVAEELATSTAQITALVRRGDLPALKLGGRSQWRIERSRLEEYIARAYDETARELRERRERGEEPEDLAEEEDAE